MQFVQFYPEYYLLNQWHVLDVALASELLLLVKNLKCI
jgi:hypothetical protein